MDQNTAAIYALKEYLKIKSPGYAFLIEAPWGAGKTHLVKQQLSAEFSEGHALYVSLNGVADNKAFRRALLANLAEDSLTSAAEKFGNALGKLTGVGDVGSLVLDTMESQIIRNLPGLIVFDDVERCEMSTGKILGLINDFVEHQKKNVILCAYIERASDNKVTPKRDDFLSRKEKVVGRTVMITADADDALSDFIETMPEGQGRRWFETNKDLVVSVFSEAGHSNLRVLRQCLHDCGRVIDVLEEDLLASTGAMARFVQTFFALSMALSVGEISAKHLSERDNYENTLAPKEGEKPHPLRVCIDRHSHAEIFAGESSSIIPVGLGLSLIGIGYETPKKVNQILRSTGQFTGELEVPLWRRFVEWRKMPTAELEETYTEALSYLFESDVIQAGPYLHIANDIVTIENNESSNESKLQDKIVDRISSLAKTGKIPIANYGSEFGWNIRGSNFSFGGFSYELNECTTQIIKAMKEAQLAAFEVNRPNECNRLLELLREDLTAFGNEFRWNSAFFGYQNIDILQDIGTEEFAGAVFSHVRAGQFDAVGKQLLAIANLIRSTMRQKDLTWARDVKKSLIKLAEGISTLEKARMVWFLGFNWNFPDASEGEEILT